MKMGMIMMMIMVMRKESWIKKWKGIVCVY